MANNIVGQVGNAFQVYASAARTASPDSQEFDLPPGSRVIVVTVDVTAVTSTPSTIFTIEGVDQVTGNTWLLLASPGWTSTNLATAVRTLSVGPGITAATNAAAAAPLPRKIRISAAHGNANSMTYSVAAYVS